MRLWSLHPEYLDTKGLVALWRESLLAKKVLEGKTKGYIHHPQLIRFRAHEDLFHVINNYLLHIYHEAVRRGYTFDINKIQQYDSSPQPIHVTDGQLAFELEHLKRKLQQRAPSQLKKIATLTIPKSHPLFVVISGSIEKWER